MMRFPEGTTFTEEVTTEGFTCCEMRDGLPWTYQTDLYGAAAIAHCFLFGTYMDVHKKSNGQWDLKGVTIKRYWQKDLWLLVFSTLLNVPSCSAIPSLSELKEKIITTFYRAQMDREFNSKLSQLLCIVAQRR
ncbi:mitotic checkpoint serine/threonine-protein kinase BUB1-like [Homarus americanus]|uniref:mitotic checkpoint serine/threonine-protein kinase BUB1-like n=1 Tax=Homarus americanus TaxID=6706 RepID=UPI001C467A9A|nr:mitotic checkpoint serine/threonine-protein kinase BUB1-like [Homarus americanus]